MARLPTARWSDRTGLTRLPGDAVRARPWSASVIGRVLRSAIALSARLHRGRHGRPPLRTMSCSHPPRATLCGVSSGTAPSQARLATRSSRMRPRVRTVARRLAVTILGLLVIAAIGGFAYLSSLRGVGDAARRASAIVVAHREPAGMPAPRRLVAAAVSVEDAAPGAAAAGAVSVCVSGGESRRRRASRDPGAPFSDVAGHAAPSCLKRIEREGFVS